MNLPKTGGELVLTFSIVQNLLSLYMPELPEVETTIRYLSSKVKGKKILQIKNTLCLSYQNLFLH